MTVITALAPVIGYAEAAKLAKVALATNEKVSELVVSRGLLDQAALDEILQPARLAGIEPESDAAQSVTPPEVVEGE